jgi:hypothetical protein
MKIKKMLLNSIFFPNIFYFYKLLIITIIIINNIITTRYGFLQPPELDIAVNSKIGEVDVNMPLIIKFIEDKLKVLHCSCLFFYTIHIFLRKLLEM